MATPGFALLTAVAAAACSTSSASSALVDDGGPTSDGGADVAADGAPDPCKVEQDVLGAAPKMAPFVDVAESLGLDKAGGNCLVFDDLDGDGRPDLFVGPLIGAATQAASLYLNQGDGRFGAKVSIPVAFGTKEAMIGACAAADVDADGKLDVVVSSYFAHEAHVLGNLGGGRFEDRQTLTLPVGAELTALALAAADFDGDGWSDVVMAPQGLPPKNGTDVCAPTADGFACTVPGTRCAPPPFVFRNVAGTFAAPTSMTSASECGAGNTNAIAVLDWNDDGRADLFVANDWGANRLYVNGPDAHFSEVWATYGAKAYNHGMGAAFEDFDRDGLFDVYVSDVGSDQFYLRAAGDRLVSHGIDHGVAAPTRLHSGWAPAGEDFDDDGWADVFVTNAAFVGNCDDLKNAVADGLPLSPRVQYDLLLSADAGRSFAPQWVKHTKDAVPIATFGAVAVADYDGDGRLDLLEAVGYPMRLQLLHNTAPAKHWIDVRLVGEKPDVDALGATVTVSAPGKPPWKRRVQRARGTIGASSSTLHFGLGDDARVDRIEVRWPDGSVQTVEAPAADGRIVITKAP